MFNVVIGIGSNIQPEIMIEKSLILISNYFTIIKKTEFIKTKPIGFINQNDFLNGTILLKTNLTYEEIKKILKLIEKKLDRKRTKNKNGPRTIDLDIVIYNDMIDDDFYEKDFLKKQCIELLPDLKY